jgi:hypothetical protein
MVAQTQELTQLLINILVLISAIFENFLCIGRFSVKKPYIKVT